MEKTWKYACTITTASGAAARVPLIAKTVFGLFFLASTTALCQTNAPANGPWSGQAQCRISVQGTGYSHQETHTWIVSGGSPTRQGAMRIFSGTWTVTGQGSLQRTQGRQTLEAQWTTNASMANAPVAVFLRASDGKLILKSWHAQLRKAGGVTGTQKLTINGVAQKPVTISLEAFEWAFPMGQGPSTASQISGSTSTTTNGAVGPMQPGDARGTSSCNWQFGR